MLKIGPKVGQGLSDTVVELWSRRGDKFNKSWLYFTGYFDQFRTRPGCQHDDSLGGKAKNSAKTFSWRCTLITYPRARDSVTERPTSEHFLPGAGRF